MEIYLYIVASVLIFGALMPQQGPQRKYYIGLMTLIHAFVTGFRYEHLTGDLKKYHYSFTLYDEMGWFSEELLQNGRNTAFFWLNKLVNVLSGENFQALLVVIALIIYLILAYVIYKYSTAPWLSYLTWNCMGFFIFGLSAIMPFTTSITSSLVRVFSGCAKVILEVIDLPFSSAYVSTTSVFLTRGQFASAIALPMGANLSLMNERSISIPGNFEGSSYLIA